MMRRNLAIACYIGVELETPELIKVFRNVNKFNSDFKECVWYPMHYFKTALSNMEPSKILSRTLFDFSLNDDYFHIMENGKIWSANEEEVSWYLCRHKDALIKYLQGEEYGHTDNPVLDRIINADEIDMFNENYTPFADKFI